MNFSDVMSREGAMKCTENGAKVFNTTGEGAILDMFSEAGALRCRSEQEIRNKFAAAYREDALLATKMLFYIGDIRQGGVGERRTFRICLKWMAQNYPKIVIKNISLIPYFNRFDSWMELVGTPCEQKMWETAATVLTEDVKAMKASTKNAFVPASLLAKWMPSENASSLKTRKLAMRAMTAMKMPARQYRKMLTALRRHINVVETQMSAGKWDEIDYTKVPSYAMHNYGSAFAKHDHARFDAFLNMVQTGEVQIKASTLFPYDLVKDYLFSGGRIGSLNSVTEAQWNALPNYVNKQVNAIVLADVSGSMFCDNNRPIQTSIGLATYFAQHNTGHYHNKYMTFTNEPHYISLSDEDTLQNCIKKVLYTDVGYNTNLERAFMRILGDAIEYKVPQEEMPKSLIVISDMEIDRYMNNYSKLDFVQSMRAKFESYGYKLPNLVLWNVQARNDSYLTHKPPKGVVFLSGQSAATFQHLCRDLDGVTAYELMLDILNGKAYAKVTI